MKFYLAYSFGLFLIVSAAVRMASAEFMETYSNLKKHVFNEPASSFYLGFGVSPVSIMKDRFYVGANFFQVHRITPQWDVEVFSASYGSSQSQLEQARSNNFTFRTIPKFRILPFMSCGIVAGLELISFPLVDVKLLKQPYTTENQPFSTHGFIYGIAFSETFDYLDSYKIKINQIFYKQTYSIDKTAEGWSYYFVDRSIREAADVVEPSQVFMLEFSLLY
jgi:hypothetical protein